jgi:hypothetical protein
LYGANWNKKMLRGTVLRAYQQSSATNRRYWIVVARYEFSSDGLGRTKEKELQMRSIIAEPPVTLATTMITTETTPQALAATLPLSIVAATAAAAAATMTAMEEL